MGRIYFSSNPLPSVTYQLLSSALMAEVNLCSWGKGKMGCVAEIKSLFAAFVESTPLEKYKARRCHLMEDRLIVPSLSGVILFQQTEV